LVITVKHADVFIQNLMLGVIDRLVAYFQKMRRLNSPLIRCDIGGYGSTGKFVNVEAYDLLIQAETGFSSITGTESKPGRVGVSAWDIATGMTAYQSILQALYARFKTNQGRQIEVSLYRIDWMIYLFILRQILSRSV